MAKPHGDTHSISTAVRQSAAERNRALWDAVRE